MNVAFKLDVGLFKYYGQNTNANLYVLEGNHVHPDGKLPLDNNVLTWTQSLIVATSISSIIPYFLC